MTKKLLMAAIAALTVAGSVATPASAHPWGWYHGYGRPWVGGYWGRPYYRGYGPGVVATAGLVGLAAGAALAAPPRYYALPPAYYAGYGCRGEWRWNLYRGGYDRIRVCY